MSYQKNNSASVCYYVNLNTYTKGKFGNTNFNPPLSEPILKDTVSYTMNNYESLGGHPQMSSMNTNNYRSYPYFQVAYNKPDCNLCTKSDCDTVPNTPV